MQKLWDKKALFLHQVLDGKVRLVGGCVRDYLSYKKFEDRDMATTLTPDEVVARLQKHHIPYLEIGRAFGTIVAKVDGTPFEITTLRKDIETDGRHAVVGFTKSWATDARRRDFTINALYADVEGKIYDYVGSLADLKSHRIRFVGNAKTRMQEDYLRLLRYFRFWARVGANKIDPEVREAVPQIIPNLKKLSLDRRRDEMFKIVTDKRAKAALSQMKKLKILGADLLNIPFSKKQQKVLKEKGLEKMLASFGFSGYNEKKGDENDKTER